MIRKIRDSRTVKAISIVLVFNFFLEPLIPLNRVFALTGGPAQPEFNSFSPVGTSDMVDLASGDFSYNIPIMDVGGYPINLAYQDNITTDQEASWVGLGWNISVGQITRNVRGIPDDFDGDQMNYQNHTKDNLTVGARFNLQPGLFGTEDVLSDFTGDPYSFGLSVQYNTYNGFSIKPSFSATLELGNYASVGFSTSTGNDGLSLTPNASIHSQEKGNERKTNDLSLGVGLPFNSRQGIKNLNLNMSHSAMVHKKMSKATNSGGTGGSINFVNNTFTPSIRNKKITGGFTANLVIGGTFFGVEGEGDITAYGTVQSIANSELNRNASAYGYPNTENASTKDVVLDFNREKDGAFTVNSTNLPVTNYTYDQFSIQGQGVSGSFRPYKSKVGMIYDTEVKDGSYSGSLGLEIDGGNTGKIGVDVELSQTNGRSGTWTDSYSVYGVNIASLQSSDQGMNTFLPNNLNNNEPTYEDYYYKNTGDLSTDTELDGHLNLFGGYAPVKLQIAGSKFNRYSRNNYQKRNGNLIGLPSEIDRSKRKLRNQSINRLTIKEVEDGIGMGPVAYGEESLLSSAPNHHTGEFQITRNDGSRYVYGLPVFNTKKVEASFSVDGSSANCSTGLVDYVSSGNEPDNSVNNSHGNKYFNRVETPIYGHSYLLTSVLSTDYQDVDGDGPTPDDLGSYTKFTYESLGSIYKWRVPFEQDLASYNEGLKTDPADDKGSYTYGEKEIRYVKKIETKTHVAVFYYSPRQDAIGVIGENGGSNPILKQNKIDSISLYALPEYDVSGDNATPIKTAHFKYDYELCQGVPNNTGITGNEIENQGGKLTLKEVYFTYRDSRMGKYAGYHFDYGYNPSYSLKAYDIWGNYKPQGSVCGITDDPTAREFIFTEQGSETDQYATAWKLDKITLPSGGEIEVSRESDDYAYVQNRKINKMFKVLGAGVSSTPSVNSDLTAFLFDDASSKIHANYLYVEVDEEYAQDATDFYTNYISPLPSTTYIDAGQSSESKLIYFNFFLNLNKRGVKKAIGNRSEAEINSDTHSWENVSGYCAIDESEPVNVVEIGQKTYASIPIELVNKEGGLSGSVDVNPISKSAWHFGRKFLNNYVYSNVNAQNSYAQGSVQDIAQDLVSPGILSSLLQVFEGPNGTLEDKLIGSRFIKSKSYIRLIDPSGNKKGGGSRVTEIKMSDIWATMNTASSHPTMKYGQTYEYNSEAGESSGVATYEPIGNKENPFVQPVFSSTRNLLAPNDVNFMEKPFGESFFPSPQVTYSNVKVTNREAGTNPNSDMGVKRLNKTGHVITNFYTSKDYPTITGQTEMGPYEDNTGVLASLLNTKVKKHLTASQGYVVHTNDMNGKKKSERVYAEGQDKPISGVDYNYGTYTDEVNPSDPFNDDEQFEAGKLNNIVKVIHPDGAIEEKRIGVEVDVIHDFRENESESQTIGVNTNTNGFLVGFIPGIIPTFFPDISLSEDRFRSVVTTKVIQTYGILQETIAYDAGARVSTKNIAWDAITGEVLVTETLDEYSDKYYTFNYPAHWYYDGMGLASKNLGFSTTMTKQGSTNEYSLNGVLPYSASNILTEGDELVVYDNGSVLFGWVISVNGNSFNLIDEDGNDLITNNSSTSMKIIRSGRRNLQVAGISSLTLQQNPLEDLSGNEVSILPSDLFNPPMPTGTTENWKIIDASAVDYSQNWPAQCECGTDTNNPIWNPYKQNEKGVWRTKSSHTYLEGRNHTSQSATPRVDGYYSNFSPFYRLTNQGGWAKDYNNWTFTSEVSMFSPRGFELENRDALNRYSGAQYGYNYTFPMAVGANTEYIEIGYDGFEDYGFEGCQVNAHFNFSNGTGVQQLTPDHFHTGRYSIPVSAQGSVTMQKSIECRKGGEGG